MRTLDIYQYEDTRYIAVIGHIYSSVGTHIADVRAVWSCQGAARHLLLARGAGTHCSARPDDCIPNQSVYYHQPVRQSMCCVFVGGWVGVRFESDSPSTDA